MKTLPQRLQGRLSPFICSIAAAVATGYLPVHNWATGKSSNTLEITLFSLSLVLVVVSLLIRPNTN
jgi:hypothetical protein